MDIKTKNFMNRIKTILICGLVRNGEETVKAAYKNIFSAFSNTNFKIQWLIIESDSEDNTILELEEISKMDSDFKYLTLGELKNTYPLRTDRIAHCRNTYVEKIRNDPTYKNIEYVAVADMDGVNNLLNKDGINSCWAHQNWDVCAANQSGPYYDIWALRHKDWSPNDCWHQFNFLEKFSKNSAQNILSAVYSKMIPIPIDTDWIQVESAFGGFAIYKKNLFELSEYNGLTDDGKEICEHVAFHKNLILKNKKIFINPRMINCGINEHSIYSSHISQTNNVLVNTFFGQLVVDKNSSTCKNLIQNGMNRSLSQQAIEILLNHKLNSKPNLLFLDFSPDVGSDLLLISKIYQEKILIYAFHEDQNEANLLHTNIKLNNTNNIKIKSIDYASFLTTSNNKTPSVDFIKFDNSIKKYLKEDQLESFIHKFRPICFLNNLNQDDILIRLFQNLDYVILNVHNDKVLIPKEENLTIHNLSAHS
jgi:hypothetical protein